MKPSDIQAVCLAVLNERLALHVERSITFSLSDTPAEREVQWQTLRRSRWEPDLMRLAEEAASDRFRQLYPASCVLAFWATYDEYMTFRDLTGQQGVWVAKHYVTNYPGHPRSAQDCLMVEKLSPEEYRRRNGRP